MIHFICDYFFLKVVRILLKCFAIFLQMFFLHFTRYLGPIAHYTRARFQIVISSTKLACAYRVTASPLDGGVARRCSLAPSSESTYSVERSQRECRCDRRQMRDRYDNVDYRGTTS